MKMRVTARGLAGLTRVLRATRHGKRSSGSNRWCVHAWVRVCARTRFLPVRFPRGIVGQTSRNRLPGEIRRPLKRNNHGRVAASGRRCCPSLFSRPRRRVPYVTRKNKRRDGNVRDENSRKEAAQCASWYT